MRGVGRGREGPLAVAASMSGVGAVAGGQACAAGRRASSAAGSSGSTAASQRLGARRSMAQGAPLHAAAPSAAGGAQEGRRRNGVSVPARL